MCRAEEQKTTLTNSINCSILSTGCFGGRPASNPYRLSNSDWKLPILIMIIVNRAMEVKINSALLIIIIFCVCRQINLSLKMKTWDWKNLITKCKWRLNSKIVRANLYCSVIWCQETLHMFDKELSTMNILMFYLSLAAVNEELKKQIQILKKLSGQTDSESDTTSSAWVRTTSCREPQKDLQCAEGIISHVIFSK